MGGRGRGGKPKAPPVPTDRLLRSDQATANSAVAELDNLLDDLNSSLTSIEEDSKDLIEYRESTHFRAPSVEGAVGYQLPYSEIKQMSSSEEDLDYTEPEGGFSQAQLEALESIDARRPSGPETGTVGKLLTAFEEQQPHLYAAALKAKTAAAKISPLTAALEVTRQGLLASNLVDQNMAPGDLTHHSPSDSATPVLKGAGNCLSGSSAASSSDSGSDHLVRRNLPYAEDQGPVQEELKRFGNLIVTQFGLAANKHKQVIEALGKDLGEVDLRVQLSKVEQSIDRLNGYVNQLSEMSTRWEGGKALVHHFVTLEEFLEAFFALKVGINAELSDMKGQGVKSKASSAQSDFQKLLKVAKAKPVDLPTYDGKSKAAYAGFKESFQYIIERTNVPPELWGGQLESSLIGDALDYIGGKGQWHGKYNELWEILDDKYANRWNVTTEAVSNFYFKPLPQDTRKEHLKWYYEMANDLRALVKLNLSVEQLGTSMILQMMKADYANEVRGSLKVKAGPLDAGKAAFSLQELTSAVNDTLAVNHDPDQFCAPRSTLTLQTAVTPSASSPAAGATSFKSGGQRGRGSSWRGRGRGSFRGRGRGRGFGPKNCYVCPGKQAEGHMVKNCPNFKTVDARKRELIRQNRCAKCTAWEHGGTPCLQISMCPVSGCGEFHRSYLCSKAAPAQAGSA